MAEVWRARSRGVAGFEKTVVVKRVLPSLLERPGFADLLVREAKIAARLSHPNIVQIYDLGHQEGGYYIAMELLRGRDLAAALAHRPVGETPLTLPLRLWIASEVARALDYAHRAKGDDGKPLQIVHRDISPQNVLLGFEGEVKVADFGIARADEPGLGRGEDPRVLRGKYAYMSPEQARGEPLDRRSDLFSFGIVLFELLTRRRMFRGKTSAEALELLRRAELPPVPDDLPLPELRAILDRALAPDLERRYASAAEIHADLQRSLASLGGPIGPTELAGAMQRMFPPVERAGPNKLRVDLLRRAHEDASAAGDPARTRALLPAPTASITQHTQPLPVARRRADSRRLLFLAARARVDDERRFGPVVEATGGTVVSTGRDGLLLAAYGLSGVERAAGHAARAALELRRLSRLDGVARIEPGPPMAIVAGEGRVHEGGVAEPDPSALARALALLERTDGAEIRVAVDLRPELARELRLHEHEGDLLIEGFRARHERDAGAMRRRTPLLGHRDVLRALSGLLADTARHAGAVVHLVGEPGVGKSRVLAELRASAAPRDFAFVHGRADEAEVEGRFGLLAELVADLAGVEPEDAPATRFTKVDGLRTLGLSAREARLLGELLGLAYPLPAEARSGRPRGVELALALRKAVRALASERAVVLALEDLQWADEATRQVLPLLLHGLSRLRVLVLLAHRPGSADPLPSGRTLELGALDESSSGLLIAQLLGARAAEPSLAAWVHAETGGVPGWIELLAEPLRSCTHVADGVLRLDGAAPARALLPDAIRSMLIARTERLRPRDRSMLRAIAAMGGSVDVLVISAVEGLVGRTERPILRRLLLRRLLVADDAPTVAPDRLGAWGGDEKDEQLPSRVRIPSELMRRALLRELDPDELGRLHARIVRTLERVGRGQDLEALERLAEHAARSTEPAAAIGYLARAAESARAQGDAPRAVRHRLRAAVVAAEAGVPAEETAELALRAADEALAAGSIELVPRALEHVDAITPALAVRRGLVEARLARCHREPGRAVDALREAPLDAIDPPLRADAALVLAIAWLELGPPSEALSVLEPLRHDVELRGRAEVHGLRAVALTLDDRLDEAQRELTEALASAARSGEGRARAAALGALAVLQEARQERLQAARAYEACATLAEALGAHGELPRLYGRAAALRWMEERRPTSAARAASEWARRTDQPSWDVVALRAGADAAEAPPTLLAGRREEALLVAEMHACDALARGEREAAELALEEAVALAAEAGWRGLARRLSEVRERLRDA